jgi:hypothetical protein
LLGWLQQAHLACSLTPWLRCGNGAGGVFGQWDGRAGGRPWTRNAGFHHETWDYRPGSQVHGIFQFEHYMLTLAQLIESTTVVDCFVRTIHFSAVSVLNDAVTHIIVVRHESDVEQMRLLRQVDKLYDSAIGHAVISGEKW